LSPPPKRSASDASRAGFPSEAIRYCRGEAGAALSDIATIAVNSDPRASFLKKVGFALRHRPDFGLILDRIRNYAKRQSIEAELDAAFPNIAFRVSHRGSVNPTALAGMGLP
jgi:carbamoyltransferase